MPSWLSDTHLALIEDAAQAHGATVDGQRAGSFGVAGCFSFYPGKNLGAFGDAGAVVTDDGALAACHSRRSRTMDGRQSPAHVHSVLARNSRLDALQAGVLSVKLPRLDAWNEAQTSCSRSVPRACSDDEVRPVAVAPGSTSVYHLIVVRVPGRDALLDALRSEGIRDQEFTTRFRATFRSPYRGYVARASAVAEAAAGEILSLPLFPHITEASTSPASATCVNEHVARRR